MPLRPDVAVVFPAAHQRGGVERVAWDLCHYLADRGTAVSFVGRELADGADPRIRFERVDSSGGFLGPLAFRRAAARQLAKLSPECTVTLGVECPPGDVLLVGSVHRSWLAAARTVPVAGHDVPAQIRYLMPRHLVLLALERAYFHSARPRAVLCCSERESSDVATYYGVDAARLLVVPNGFDPEVFAPRPGSAVLRDRAGARPDDVLLLFLANELHRKGFGVLLRALALLADERVRLVVVGRADIAPYERELDRLGLRHRVHWVGATSDAVAWYASCDLLVLPSQYEPFGLVVVEALATGLPVITTRLTGASAAVLPGVNGLVQEDPYDAEELARLLRRSLDDTTRSQWSAAAPGSVERYRQDVVFDLLAEHLSVRR